MSPCSSQRHLLGHKRIHLRMERPQSCMEEGLSNAFLSTGMPVTFKVSWHQPLFLHSQFMFRSLRATASWKGTAFRDMQWSCSFCALLTRASVCFNVPLQDITYTVVNNQQKNEKINILKSVSGYLKPGKMTALMGPSGSGEAVVTDMSI